MVDRAGSMATNGTVSNVRMTRARIGALARSHQQATFHTAAGVITQPVASVRKICGEYSPTGRGRSEISRTAPPVRLESRKCALLPARCNTMYTIDCSRRQFLRLGLAGSVGFALPATGHAAAVRAGADRMLEFYNTHTDERLRSTYWADGSYVASALTDINFILRDFRANEIKAIDLRLLDLLHRLNASLDTSQPFHIISGYRTAATNAMLRGASEGVAQHSL